MDQTTDFRTIAFDAIRAALVEILGNDGKRSAKLRMETSLIDDLAMDSFLFVDLTLMLEERLKIENFPMQRWADTEMERGGHFTIGSLVELCVEVIDALARGTMTSPRQGP